MSVPLILTICFHVFHAQRTLMNSLIIYCCWQFIVVQGTQAFCSGGDQAVRKADGYADYDKFGRLNVLDLQVPTYLPGFIFIYSSTL